MSEFFCLFLAEQVQQEYVVERKHVWRLQVHIVLFAYSATARVANLSSFWLAGAVEWCAGFVALC